MHLEQNISLASFTTLGIGGPARWFVAATSEDEVRAAILFAREQGLPVFVLGGGSNLLVADGGFHGLVLHIALQGITSHALAGGRVLLQVAAGEDWDGLVQLAVERDLAGLECLAGIPGTVGGTPVQNVGAYGQEVSETIHALRCFDREATEFVYLSNADCEFAYRTSLLNTVARGRYVITRVDFALTPHGAPRLEYADIRKHLAGDPPPTLRQVADTVRQIRRTKGMVVDAADPNSRSAGSFFRNPVVSFDLLPNIAEAAGIALDDVPRWPAGEGCVKLPAAWLLEHAGFVRGFVLGSVGISARHTLALINRGGATARDITVLRDYIIATVLKRFSIRLEQEPVLLGDFTNAPATLP